MVQAIHRRVWFNGTTSEITGTDLDIDVSFTIGIRFKTDKLKNAYQTLVAKGDGGSGNYVNYLFRVDPGGVLFGRVADSTHSASTDVTGLTRVDDGAWHYATLVWDRTAQTLTVYRDSMRDAAPVVSAFVNLYQMDNPFRIGRWASLYLNGYISDFHIHLRALSESEINYNYLHPNNPSRRDLAVSYTQDSIDQPAAGTWQDRSGNARNGTITNATTSKYPAISAGRNALFFPTAAGSDRVDCGNGASLDPNVTGLISIECWMKMNPRLSFIQPLSKHNGVATGWFIQWEGGAKTFSMGGNAVRVITSVPLNLNYEWLHITCTYTLGAATGKIYINGIDKTAASIASAIGNPAINLIVGNYSASLIYSPIGGFMHSARLYNRILTAEEVAYNYRHPNNPKRR